MFKENDYTYLLFRNSKTNIFYIDFCLHFSIDETNKHAKLIASLYPNITFISAINKSIFKESYSFTNWLHADICIDPTKRHKYSEADDIIYFPNNDVHSDKSASVAVKYKDTEGQTRTRRILFPFIYDGLNAFTIELTKNIINGRIEEANYNTINVHSKLYDNSPLNNKNNVLTPSVYSMNKAYYETVKSFILLKEKLNNTKDAIEYPKINADFTKPIDRIGNDARQPAYMLYLDRYSVKYDGPTKVSTEYNETIKYHLNNFIYLNDPKNLYEVCNILISILNDLEIDNIYYFKGILYEPLEKDTDSYTKTLVPLQISTKVLSELCKINVDYEKAFPTKQSSMNRFF